jgi:hypothetical protein
VEVGLEARKRSLPVLELKEKVVGTPPLILVVTTE